VIVAALTPFGQAVRKARIDAQVTLAEMGRALHVSPAFLSALERGRKPVSARWVSWIEGYFGSKGVTVPRLADLAAVANGRVSLAGCAPAQAMLIARLARLALSAEQLGLLERLLDDCLADPARTA
jgi:transcriptional regulator with XRE-family HTH domain